MEQSTHEHVTRVLQRMADGQSAAASELLPLVYDELRRLAQSHLKAHSPGHTLQATALVHEAYLRLAGGGEGRWESRAHFFAVAAMAMRQILANHARDKKAIKRGGDRVSVTLGECSPAELANAPGSGQTR